MSLLRVYSKNEWESLSVDPWIVCPTCDGSGRGEICQDANCEYHQYFSRDQRVVCPDCEGHGSARAMVLAAKADVQKRDYPAGGKSIVITVRCEGCGHPMSEGTWEGERAVAGAEHERPYWLKVAEDALRSGKEPVTFGVHYSPCDEGCRHGDEYGRYMDGLIRAQIVRVPPDESFEASWRQVDARRLSWDSDLSPGQTAVLCLRCFAKQS